MDDVTCLVVCESAQYRHFLGGERSTLWHCGIVDCRSIRVGDLSAELNTDVMLAAKDSTRAFDLLDGLAARILAYVHR